MAFIGKLTPTTANRGPGPGPRLRSRPHARRRGTLTYEERPDEDASHASATITPRIEDAPRSAPADAGKGRILVVEDESSARRGYALLLGCAGFEVVTVGSAEEGLERLRDGSVDLVLSDVNLPGLDGFSLTSRIRDDEQTRDLPIVLVSAAGETPRCVTGLECGADDFFAKPVDPDILLARIEASLRRGLRQRELVRRSVHDPLTGLLNRGAIQDEILRELRRVGRTGLSLSLVMVDLDGFKAINDAYGHLAGDAALRAAAERLSGLVRATDRVGRFGGDEFLVLLPDTDEAQMMEMVARMRLEWRRHPPLVPGFPRPMLASFGGATAERGATLQSLIRAADDCMYRHKRCRSSR
jgi:diguanylate cyclase (GGDEF)-like protein